MLTVANSRFVRVCVCVYGGTSPVVVVDVVLLSLCVRSKLCPRRQCNDIWVASCRRLARSSLLYKNIEKQVFRVATLYESGIS